jgi:hypothetical protein
MASSLQADILVYNRWVLSGYLKDRVAQRAVFLKILLADPFWLQKITSDPHILAYVNIDSGW